MHFFIFLSAPCWPSSKELPEGEESNSASQPAANSLSLSIPQDQSRRAREKKMKKLVPDSDDVHFFIKYLLAKAKEGQNGPTN